MYYISLFYVACLTSSASKHALGSKLSKSRKGKGRPSRASRTTPAAACKPEAEMEASSCGKMKTTYIILHYMVYNGPNGRDVKKYKIS